MEKDNNNCCHNIPTDNSSNDKIWINFIVIFLNEITIAVNIHNNNYNECNISNRGYSNNSCNGSNSNNNFNYSILNDSRMILVLIKISTLLIALIITLPVILTILLVIIKRNNDNNNNNKGIDKNSNYKNKDSSRNDHKYKKLQKY